MVPLLLVVVPCFDNAGITGCDIALGKTVKLGPVGTQNFHEETPLVRDESQLFYLSSVYKFLA
jgi:hypothetical protein